jgi:hypothetical protein
VRQAASKVFLEIMEPLVVTHTRGSGACYSTSTTLHAKICAHSMKGVNAMRRFNDKVGQWFFMLLTSFTLPAAAADDASLQISVEGGAFNAKFKFFNAADGCPSYNDIPGAPNFLGGVRASDKGSSKRLPLNTPIHVFLFKPRDTPGISAAGGATEIRRRALQLTLSGDASLRYITFNDHVPSWEASDNLSVAPWGKLLSC